MHPVPTGSQDHLFGDAQEPSYCYAIQNGTLNTLQPNKTSFGCVSEIVSLGLVTVILMYL